MAARDEARPEVVDLAFCALMDMRPEERVREKNADADGDYASRVPTASQTQPEVVLDLTGDRTPVRELVREIRRRWTLLPMLAARDFRGRYRSAALGIAWAVLTPLFQGLILAFVFSHVVRIHTRTNYAAFVITGTMTWSYLTSTVSTASTSIVDQAGVAGRVYFPRVFLPGQAVLSNSPALVINLLIAVLITTILGVHPTWRLVVLPAAIALAILIAYAVSAPLALLNVYFRDVRYLIGTILQVMIYATPVIYPLTKLGQYKDLMAINPACGVIELARWSFNANNGDPLLIPVLGTVGWIVILVFVSIAAYSKHERLACDRL